MFPNFYKLTIKKCTELKKKKKRPNSFILYSCWIIKVEGNIKLASFDWEAVQITNEGSPAWPSIS